MRLLYTKSALRNLSQESRIVFVGQFRLMSQHTVADILDFIYTMFSISLFFIEVFTLLGR